MKITVDSITIDTDENIASYNNERYSLIDNFPIIFEGSRYAVLSKRNVMVKRLGGEEYSMVNLFMVYDLGSKEIKYSLVEYMEPVTIAKVSEVQSEDNLSSVENTQSPDNKEEVK